MIFTINTVFASLWLTCLWNTSFRQQATLKKTSPSPHYENICQQMDPMKCQWEMSQLSGPIIPKTKIWALPSVHQGHRGKPFRQPAPVAGPRNALRLHTENHSLMFPQDRKRMWAETGGRKPHKLVGGRRQIGTCLGGEETGLCGR